MKTLIGTFAAALILGGAGASYAHPTGNERRTDEACHSFEKGMNKHKLKACMACMKKGGHHFHPQGKSGKRCEPDDGKAHAGGEHEGAAKENHEEKHEGGDEKKE